MKITGDDIAFGSATVALAILALAAFLTSIPIWVPSDLFLRMALGALWWVAGAALLFAGVFGGLYAHARVEEAHYRCSQLDALIRNARTGTTGPLVVRRPSGLAETDLRQTERGAP